MDSLNQEMYWSNFAALEVKRHTNTIRWILRNFLCYFPCLRIGSDWAVANDSANQPPGFGWNKCNLLLPASFCFLWLSLVLLIFGTTQARRDRCEACRVEGYDLSGCDVISSIMDFKTLLQL